MKPDWADEMLRYNDEPGTYRPEPKLEHTPYPQHCFCRTSGGSEPRCCRCGHWLGYMTLVMPECKR